MSEELKNKKCVPCEGGTPPLDKGQVESLKKQVSEKWETDFHKIWTEFKFKNFKEGMTFVSKVADLAEAEGHHPDIFLSYSRVKIELWTHAVGGLSENDFILAAKIDEISKT